MLVLTLLTLFGTEKARSLEPAPYREGVHVGDLGHSGLDEASGLACSRRREDLLWLVNDSGHEPLLFAVRPDGVCLGSVRVAGVENRDWEDLASFRLGDLACLLVADVGDNESRRNDCVLHVVEEPGVTASGPAVSVIRPRWSIEFRYEDGPRDCEAAAVDPDGERVLLLSKRDVPPVLYALPLRPPPGVPVVLARRLTTLSCIPRPAPEDVEEDPVSGRHRSQCTAMDMTADGRGLAVLTYKHAYVFSRRPGESWLGVLGRLPRRLAVPPLPQGEALCYGADGSTIFVTSEGRPAPLYRFDKRADP